MARETWTLYSPAAPDGYVVTDGWVRDVETREGLYRTPPRRGSNGAAGQQHGAEWTAKPYGEGSFQQQIWLMADMGREQLEQWYDELLRVAAWPYDLIRVVRKLADGSERECYAELATSLEPVPAGQLGIRVGLDWTVPEGFWRDLGGAGNTVPLGGAPSGLVSTFNSLRGGTAPIPAIVDIHGAISAGTTFTQPLTGDWLRIDVALSATQTVHFHSEAGEATIYDSATLVLAPFYSFSYSGRTFLELPPVASPVALQTVLTFAGAAPGLDATLQLSGARRWLA